MQFYFVRIGSWGDIVRCRVGGGGPFGRGTRVICRTPRGLELGLVTAPESAVEAETVSPIDSDPGPLIDYESDADAPATILRATTAEDELLISRLERHRQDAMKECRRCLAAAGSSAVLLDVDQVFDAATLIFYFLSPPAPTDQELVQSLAQRYESRVRSGHFAKLLAQGCGPGCGTKDCGTESPTTGGCSGTCAVCVVATAGKRP